MPEHLNFSSAAWSLLELLQQQADVSFEVVHVSLDPVRQSTNGELLGALREPRLEEELLKAVRTGEVRVDAWRDQIIGIFPLRRAREIVGCLIVTGRSSSTADIVEAGRVVERTGAIARTALESDLALSGQLADAQALTRRLHGILRFLGHLGSYESEREIVNAVLQAATVWFDLDCRIYQRQPDGSFTLAGALPGSEQPAIGARLEPARAEQLLSERRFSSAGDLEDLGLSGRRDEVLMLPIGSEPTWIILLSGVVDTNAELTFAAIARVLAGELQGRELARVERWQDRLAATPIELVRAPQRLIERLFEELAGDVGAETGRLTLRDGETVRDLATVGAQGPTSVDDTERASRQLGSVELDFSVSASSRVELRLWRSSPFPAAAAGSVQAWIKVVRPRLAEMASGLLTGGDAVSDRLQDPAFERRIQEEIERAKRFNLGLGLVLIGTRATRSTGVLGALSDAVRTELRASDLLGRVRGDLVAVLLVHAGSEGADSVAERLRRRLEAVVGPKSLGPMQLGKAVFSPDCASADALIAQALRQTQDITVRN